MLDNIKVAIRIRPFTNRELEISDIQTLKVLDQESLQTVPILQTKSVKKTYKFNWVFDRMVSQKEIFEKTLEHQILCLLDGHNYTLISYGASGSGKSHTLMKLNEDYGCLVRSLNKLFQTISTKKRKIQVKMSYLEISQEQLYDLLNNLNANIEIRDDKDKDILISGLREIDVSSTQEVINLIQFGKRLKSTKQHEILTFNFYIQDTNEAIMSKFIVADLGWVERGGQKNQNISLQALNNCISLLSEAKNKNIQPHIPYRNSKLTRILKESLGGNSRTLIISCVSQAVLGYEDTITTLEYSSMAMGIFNQSIIKSMQQPQQDLSSVYDQLIRENAELKKQLNIKQQQKNINDDTNQIKLYEENIIEHFNNEQDINQSIFKYNWEAQLLQFRINETQENLQRIDGLDRIQADSLRTLIQNDTKQLNIYEENMQKYRKQTTEFPLQRRALEENIKQSLLSETNKLYLMNLIEKHILRLQVLEIKHKEQINELYKQEQERILAIQRSQITLRDRIIADQKKHITQHTKNQSLQHFSQVDTTTEVIDGNKVKLKHFPLPKVKDHYFNREAYLQRRESPLSKFSPRLQTPLQLKDKKPYVPKTPNIKLIENLSTPILPKTNPLTKVSPQKPIDSKSMVALPFIPTTRNVAKFVYDWRSGGYKFLEDKKPFPSQKELKQITLPKQQTPLPQQLDRSFFTNTSRSASTKRISNKSSLMLPGKVHESPYVRGFINKEVQGKLKLQQLNQKLQNQKLTKVKK